MIATITDASWTEMILTRVCEDLTMMLDHELPVGEIATQRASTRPAGKGGVHVSFKFGLKRTGDGRTLHGALLAPLPDAMAMASYLMMASALAVVDSRAVTMPDESAKEGLLEIASLVATAIDGAVRESHDGEWTAHTLGCQGVKAGVRPALSYNEGDSLVTATMTTQVGQFEPFELLLILPDLAV